MIGSWADCHIPVMEFEPSHAGRCARGTRIWYLPATPPRPAPTPPGSKNTYLCIPILAQGETLGILHLQATDEAPQLDASELSFKTTFAGQVGLSIANIKLREALRTQSVRDALPVSITGATSRRSWSARCAARRERHRSLGILMIDLDHFKKFNDTYGHDAGDAVLRETGAFLIKGVRAEDFVCRFGGEEFVVILPTANMQASRARAERLRTKMRELTDHVSGQVARDGHDFRWRSRVSRARNVAQGIDGGRRRCALSKPNVAGATRWWRRRRRRSRWKRSGPVDSVDGYTTAHASATSINGGRLSVCAEAQCASQESYLLALVALHHAVFNVDHAVSVFGDVMLVGDQHDGVSLAHAGGRTTP